ncbi:RNA-binding domain-containing protein [Hesseltinella vesiculosa]|uniref:RNA-binding domain-containing protein n=1 Tax=Hesseltinella vesiculosa TaxID=101127 RepID=A0A1X2GW82_9FUNG|nr:RNA-binding domain-containing protein [Hesseltinella vesiculosa]
MADKKNILYVGGLDEQVTQEMLHAAFIPFGDLVSVELALDHGAKAQHKGFGFVHFEEIQDALAAQDNMHLSELLGRTIKVTAAKPSKLMAGSNRAIWDDDEYKREHLDLPEPGVQPTDEPEHEQNDDQDTS